MVWFSLAITVAMLVFRDAIVSLGRWGYIGAFVVSGLSSATLVLPAPGSAFILMMAPYYNLVLLGMAAGMGGALGSLTAYVVGAQAATAMRHRRSYRFAEGLMRHLGPGIIFTFALVPFLPVDLAGALAGAVRYPARKFLVYTAAGGTLKTIALLYGFLGSLSWLAGVLERWESFLSG